MTTSGMEILTGSPEETINVGRALADWLREGDVVLLHGDLGAGKTTLVKGIAMGFRIDAVVSSPTFSLVNEYDAGLAAPVTRLHHLDLYRLRGEDDLASIGFEDYLAPFDGITLVEWPERAASVLPEIYLLIEIESVGSDRRRLRIVPIPSDAWATRVESLRTLFGLNAG
jgi:tRNA threonylcarbamoyladenosine biosynthesis protein TsaE